MHTRSYYYTDANSSSSYSLSVQQKVTTAKKVLYVNYNKSSSNKSYKDIKNALAKFYKGKNLSRSTRRPSFTMTTKGVRYVVGIIV